MPKLFEDCVKRGGRVRTIKPDAHHYQHICYIGGKSYAGEVKENSETAEAMKKMHKGVAGEVMRGQEE